MTKIYQGRHRSNVRPRGRRGGVRIVKGEGTVIGDRGSEAVAPRRSAPGIPTSGHRPRRYRVVLNTYERPEDALRILRDLWSASAGYDVVVDVYDDCSAADYSRVQAFCGRQGWTFDQNSTRRGREGFARWIHQILARTHGRITDELVILLQDDMRLSSRFFDRLGDAWNATPEKPCLLIPYRDRRFGSPQWTGRAPEPAGVLTRMGWTDCCFVADRDALAPFVRNPPQIDQSRWIKSPSASSGLGAYLSHTAERTRIPIFATPQSFIVHVGASESKMHPSEREKHPLVNLAFVDGQRSHDALMQRPRVIAGMASIPKRADILPRVLDTIAPQIDELNVYLNGYSSIPKCLTQENRCVVNVARSQDHGDLGDAGKFFVHPGPDEYLLTCDDDILYPRDYAQRMVRAVESYGRTSIVSAHGSKLPSRLESYFSDRILYPCLGDVRADALVQVPGTGVMAMHGSTIRLPRECFGTTYMADVHVAVAAHRAKVPVYVIAHQKGWLAEVSAPGSLYQRFRGDDSSQTRALQELLG